jgi:hypothetical protein
LGFPRVRIWAEKSGTCSIGARGVASPRIITSTSDRGASGPSLDFATLGEGPTHWRRRSLRPGTLRRAAARRVSVSGLRATVTRLREKVT